VKPLHRLTSVHLAGWAVSGAAAHAAFGVVTTIVLARALGPTALGAYGVFLSVAFLLNQMGEMGLGTAFVRLATPLFQRDEDARGLHSTFLSLRLATVAVLALAALVASGPMGRLAGAEETTRALILAASLGAVFLAIGGHHHEVLRARLRHRDAAVTRSASAFLRMLAYVLLAAAGRLTLTAALVTAVALMGFEALLLTARAHRDARLWPPHWRRPERAWLVLSGWLFVASGTAALMTHTDTLLLRWLGGLEATGWWVAASRIVSPLPLLIGALWSVALPVSVALEEPAKLHRYLRLAGRTSAFAVMGAIAATAIVPPAVALFFGPEYAGANDAARWLLVAYGANVAAVLYGGLVLRLGLERELAAVALTQLVVNTAGDIWAIPRFGATGCAAVTAIVMLMGALWSVIRVRGRERDLVATAPESRDEPDMPPLLTEDVTP
jgi:O-antigen/teichoic acid export membrane protein